MQTFVNKLHYNPLCNFCEQTASYLSMQAQPKITDVFQGIGLVCCFSMNYFLSPSSHGVKSWHKFTGGAGGGAHCLNRVLLQLQHCYCSTFSRNKAGKGSKLKFQEPKLVYRGSLTFWIESIGCCCSSTFSEECWKRQQIELFHS